MEEQEQIISVEIFNEIHHLNREDFLNFHPILNESDFKLIKIPFYSLNECKMRTLNVMVYFVISVQRNVNVFEDDNLGDRYRALCAKQISEYYIKNRFIIEEYEFSYFASKALGNKIEECAHIIYYLIYGRFASHPYINSLCAKEHNSIFKQQRSMKRNCSIKKRTIKLQHSQSQFELDLFRKDLKSALNSDCLDNNNLAKNSKAQKQQRIPTSTVKEEQNEKNLTMAAIVTTQREKQLNRGSSLNSFIPHRVTQGENSLIFQNLAQDRKCYQTVNNWNRKGLMRKQKFNEFFDINELQIKTKLKRNPFALQQNKQNFTKNIFQLNKDTQQMNKINYENFKRISTGLKNKSATLDKIRGQCFPRGHKFNFQKQTNETLQETLQRLAEFENQRSKEFILMSKRNKYHLKHRNSSDLPNYPLNNTYDNLQEPSISQQSIGKKQSIKSQRHFEYLMPTQQGEDEKQGEFAVNILRNDDSHHQNHGNDGKKSEYFAQAGLGFRKVDSKSKLHKYKADYRRFLKTQTLDRIKQSV